MGSVRLLFLADGDGLGPLRHADDAVRRFPFRAPEKDRSNGLSAAQKTPDKRGVDDRGLLADIGARKRSALTNRDVHCPEERRRHGIPFERRLHPLAVIRECEAAAVAGVIGERNQAGRGHGLDARDCGKLV